MNPLLLIPMLNLLNLLQLSNPQVVVVPVPQVVVVDVVVVVVVPNLLLVVARGRRRPPSNLLYLKMKKEKVMIHPTIPTTPTIPLEKLPQPTLQSSPRRQKR